MDGTVLTMESMFKSALERWTVLQSTGMAKFAVARSQAITKVQELTEQVQKEGLINSTAKFASVAVKPPVEFAKQTYISFHDAVAVSLDSSLHVSGGLKWQKFHK